MKIGDDLNGNISLAQALLSGHETLQSTVEVPTSPVELLREALRVARRSEKLFQASRAKREKTVVPALRLAQTEALETIDIGKGVLRFEEGAKWSPVWAQAGFLTSTQTPSTWAERETLLVTMAGFLDELPLYKNAAKNFTAVIVRKRAAALTQALLDLDVHDTQHTGLAEARKTAKKELTFRIRSFIKELNRKLSADDSRWKTYRLESPACVASRPERTRGNPGWEEGGPARQDRRRKSRQGAGADGEAEAATGQDGRSGQAQRFRQRDRHDHVNCGVSCLWD
jgi:hypothetical protein